MRVRRCTVCGGVRAQHTCVLGRCSRLRTGQGVGLNGGRRLELSWGKLPGCIELQRGTALERSMQPRKGRSMRGAGLQSGAAQGRSAELCMDPAWDCAGVEPGARAGRSMRLRVDAQRARAGARHAAA